jgi:mRNA interferase MazF
MVGDTFPLTRGGIYLARLDPARGAEVGKRRPVVVLTAQSLLEVDPPILFVCPLSSRSDPAYVSLHLALPARDRLQRPSYALIEHSRAISRQRLVSERLGMLTPGEINSILDRLERLVGR